MPKTSDHRTSGGSFDGNIAQVIDFGLITNDGAATVKAAKGTIGGLEIVKATLFVKTQSAAGATFDIGEPTDPDKYADALPIATYNVGTYDITDDVKFVLKDVAENVMLMLTTNTAASGEYCVQLICMPRTA